jgi:hypothetical protein
MPKKKKLKSGDKAVLGCMSVIALPCIIYISFVVYKSKTYEDGSSSPNVASATESKPKTECSGLSTQEIYKWRDQLQGSIDEAYPIYAKTKVIAEASAPTEKRILSAKLSQLESEMNKWQDAVDDMNQELRNRGLQP